MGWREGGMVNTATLEVCNLRRRPPGRGAGDESQAFDHQTGEGSEGNIPELHSSSTMLAGAVTLRGLHLFFVFRCFPQKVSIQVGFVQVVVKEGHIPPMSSL